MGRIRDQKQHYFDELGPYEDNVPLDPISPLELIQRQQEILLQNARNNDQRTQVKQLSDQLVNSRSKARMLEVQYKELLSELKKTEQETKDLENKLATAKKTVAELKDESTEAIENDLRNIENINQRINFNKAKKQAENEYIQAEQEWNDLDIQIKQVRADKLQLLLGADLPLEGLSVDQDGLTYNGHYWNDMSASEQLRVAVAIVRKLKPECGFVLLDKLEQFDTETLDEFGTWLEGEGLQVIATRVSTGDECQIIIEDGYVKGEETPAKPQATGWKAGAF